MRVNVLYFGVLKDFFAAEQEQIELAAGAFVADLINVLRTRAAGESAIWTSLAVAVNREYASASVPLHEGDEVALLPPVSGGTDAH